MIFGVADDHDTASAGFNFVAFGNILSRVIGSLGVKIGMNFTNDGAHVFFREHDDGVHVCQGRKNFGAFPGGHDGASFAFQRAHGRIGVHRNDQLTSEFASGMDVAYVTDVQDVEATIGERDAIAGVAPGG